MDQKQLTDGLARYNDHLRRLEHAFNTWARYSGLAVQMSADRAIQAAEGVDLAKIATFWSRIDDTGVIHEEQLRTAIECIKHLMEDEKHCGHIVGAMQSGKTTTSLALQWAGPVLYALTGKRVHPFYLIGSQTSHEDQTRTELDRFLAYYGNLEIRAISSTSPAAELDLDAMFLRAPSLANYRGHVLRSMFDDVFSMPQSEDNIHRRVGGEQGLKRIGEIYKRATSEGYRPLMIIDEPQYGAGDRLERDDRGETVRRPCVLAQIFDRIEREIGATRNDHWFVGLSATPFEMNDVNQIWEVRQYLTASYSGFNFFNERPITEAVAVKPPTTLSQTAYASAIHVPFLASVSMAAYDGSHESFRRHAHKVDFSGDQTQFQAAVEGALRDTIYAVIERHAGDPERPIGLCIRAFNDNDRTSALIKKLALDPTRVEIIEYFGAAASKISVKRAIARRQNSDLPYVVFVTNRARMADAFPVQVRFFMDLAQKASDLNALLQGLLGRACGYNKNSTVVLSDANVGIVQAYTATVGGYVHKTSRHSIPVGGGFRRGAPTGMIKLRVEMDDPLVQAFFKEINERVVGPNIEDGAAKLSVPRSKPTKNPQGFRTGPILRIAEELKLFEYLEMPEVRARLFPQLPTGFSIAKRGDKIRHSRRPGVMLTYSCNSAGDCRYTFRWSERTSAAEGGAAGRAKGVRDAGQHVEPTVYVEKYDRSTGEVFFDRKAPAGEQPGSWRAFMVTFPLRETVREVRKAEVALPTELCAYDHLLNAEERARRDTAQNSTGRRRSTST